MEGVKPLVLVALSHWCRWMHHWHHEPCSMKRTSSCLPFSPQALRPTWKWRRKITAVVWRKSVDAFIVSDVKMIFHMCSHHKTTKGIQRIPQATSQWLPKISGYFWWIFQHPATKTRGTRGSSPMKPPSPKPTGAPRWSQNPLGPLRLGLLYWIHYHIPSGNMAIYSEISH